MPRYSALSVLLLAVLLLSCSAAPNVGSSTSGSVASTSTSSNTAAIPTPEPATPLDLTGEWIQHNSGDEGSYQHATITEGTITISWVSEADDMTALYWAGTYSEPAHATDSFSWISVNDTTQTETALLASSDDTKTFTYNNGVLTYELSAVGKTMTVEMTRQ